MQVTKLYWTCGPSHAGKSTFADRWLSEATGRVVVTTDNIRRAMCGERYNKELEPVVFAHKQIMIKTMLLEGCSVLANGTNTTKESIKRLLEIDPFAEPIVFDTPLEICLERTKITGQTDMEGVIRRHHRQLQALLDQGMDNVLDEIRNQIEIRWNKK